ncbi:MAG TPA: hypothetical protein VFJ58_01555 [Armatimonadota bacterium]|nr:hypothetical protein [Armatimonadota bacterium]
MIRSFRSILVIPAALAVALGAGCNSSTVSTPTPAKGSLRVSVQLPAGASRAAAKGRQAGGAPLGAPYVKIAITDPTTMANLAQPQIIQAPPPGQTATAEFQGIPVGNIHITVTAHPDQNAAQPALAIGTADATVTTGNTTPVSITLAPTLDHLTITPTGLTLTLSNTQTSPPTGTLTAAAFDANNTSLVGEPLFWSSSNSTVASVLVDPSTGVATVTAVGPGTATIEVREFNTGKTADAVVTVVPAPVS